MSTRNLNVLHERDDAVLEPMNYLSGIPGKDIRGQLIDCIQQWLKIPEERVVDIKEIITDLHNASLLVDDIEDNSKMRRGMPVAHSIFGIPSTMNCANYVYFLALEKCHSLDNPSAISIFVQELLNLHRGQGQDILWREQCKCPTEEQYMQVTLSYVQFLICRYIRDSKAISLFLYFSISLYRILVISVSVEWCIGKQALVFFNHILQ